MGSEVPEAGLLSALCPHLISLQVWAARLLKLWGSWVGRRERVTTVEPGCAFGQVGCLAVNYRPKAPFGSALERGTAHLVAQPRV